MILTWYHSQLQPHSWPHSRIPHSRYQLTIKRSTEFHWIRSIVGTQRIQQITFYRLVQWSVFYHFAVPASRSTAHFQMLDLFKQPQFCWSNISIRNDWRATSNTLLTVRYLKSCEGWDQSTNRNINIFQPRHTSCLHSIYRKHLLTESKRILK